jgi:peptide chain release factor 3
MNPKHRDSVAFLRICSGKFERGMEVINSQSGKIYRLQRPYKLFANEREIIEEAYPGDVLGIPISGEFGIGDTLTSAKPFKFPPLPRFHPEYFATLRNADVAKQKQFIKGLHQLETEGAVQVLHNIDAFKREPVLAVVGQLQFDVVQARLKTEYSLETSIEPLSYGLARWITGPENSIMKIIDRSGVHIYQDFDDNYVALFKEPFYLKYTQETFPELTFAFLN